MGLAILNDVISIRINVEPPLDEIAGSSPDKTTFLELNPDSAPCKCNQTRLQSGCTESKINYLLHDVDSAPD